jgi:hypothetical protein
MAPAWRFGSLPAHEYVTGKYRKDLSWHPEKKEGAAEEE